MWRSPRLQLVFWFGTIESVVTLFVITIADDFGNVLRLFLLFLSLTTCGCGWSSISSSYEVRPFAPSLVALLLFLFSGLLRGLLSFEGLFGQIGLVFGLQGLLVSLIVPRIETHL